MTAVKLGRWSVSGTELMSVLVSDGPLALMTGVTLVRTSVSGMASTMVLRSDKPLVLPMQKVLMMGAGLLSVWVLESEALSVEM